MTLKIDAKFGGKPICPFKNDISILGNFYQSTWKPPNRDFDEILLSRVRKYMCLEFTGELFLMTMKKDAKLEAELSCRFKNGERNLMSFDTSKQKSQKFAL